MFCGENKTLQFPTFFFPEKVGISWNFPWITTDSGQFGRISYHNFYRTTIRVSFDGVFIGFFTRLYIFPVYIFANMVSTWHYFSWNRICHLSIVLLLNSKKAQANVTKFCFVFSCFSRLVYTKTKINGGQIFITNGSTKTH